MYHLALKSANVKTGQIPVSTSGAQTCPKACPMRKNGCYAGSGPLALHWAQVTKGARGTDWDEFCAQIAKLPDGQLWRMNQAGDLPGDGDKINGNMLRRLVKANKGKPGWTYTHKPMSTARARMDVRFANRDGFTINLSANTLTHADELSDLGIAPVVVVTAEAKAYTTPAGRKVVPCPATTHESVSCATCKLCAVSAKGRPIIGFAAHGTGAKKVINIVRGN